ncbi:unnamed protein product [Closterium sp. Naga37s-1]|nr:unnamed protein product [Closterium sp. Naga37s-1]
MFQGQVGPTIDLGLRSVEDAVVSAPRICRTAAGVCSLPGPLGPPHEVSRDVRATRRPVVPAGTSSRAAHSSRLAMARTIGIAAARPVVTRTRRFVSLVACATALLLLATAALPTLADSTQMAVASRRVLKAAAPAPAPAPVSTPAPADAPAVGAPPPPPAPLDQYYDDDYMQDYTLEQVIADAAPQAAPGAPPSPPRSLRLKVPYTIKFADVSKSYYILNYLANSVCKFPSGPTIFLPTNQAWSDAFEGYKKTRNSGALYEALDAVASDRIKKVFVWAGRKINSTELSALADKAKSSSSPSLQFLLPLTPIPPPHSHSSSPSLPFLLPLTPIPPPPHSNSSSPSLQFLLPLTPIPPPHSHSSSPHSHSSSPSLPFLLPLAPIPPPPRSHFPPRSHLFTPSLPFLLPLAPISSPPRSHSSPPPFHFRMPGAIVTVSHLFTALHSHTLTHHLSTTRAVVTVSRLFTALLVFASALACAL